MSFTLFEIGYNDPACELFAGLIVSLMSFEPATYNERG